MIFERIYGTFHPLGMINPSYSMSAMAFLNEPSMGGNRRMLSRTTCQVYFIFFVSSIVRYSPALLLLNISACSGNRSRKIGITTLMLEF